MSGLGAGIQVGWSLAIFNTPVIIVKKFYNDVYLDRYNESMPVSTFDTLWSVTNGLLPLGGCIGALSSSVAADYFGRFFQ